MSNPEWTTASVYDIAGCREWVMYKRTSPDGEVQFFVRPKDKFDEEINSPATDAFTREVLMVTDSYEIARKAQRLAMGK